MASLLPSFKGKAELWCVSVSLTAPMTAPGPHFHHRIYPDVSIITKAAFVLVSCCSIIDHVEAERTVWCQFPPTNCRVTSALSNSVVRSKTVSCVGPQFDMGRPLPFSYVMSLSQNLTLNSSAPEQHGSTWSLRLDPRQPDETKLDT